VDAEVDIGASEVMPAVGSSMSDWVIFVFG